jgi:hypothetical protein
MDLFQTAGLSGLKGGHLPPVFNFFNSFGEVTNFSRPDIEDFTAMTPFEVILRIITTHPCNFAPLSVVSFGASL